MIKKISKPQINLFCSISKGRIEEINKVLIPSIIKQKHIGEIVLTIINYKAEEEITPELITCDKGIKLNILNPGKPLGFGEAHNYAFKKINPKDFFIILNPDLSLHESCIKSLVESFNEGIGLVEARQLPFAHPKDKPKTNIFETNWASGSCLLINSNFFKSVNGFDSNYWMYLEDVDLSWKAWINGYKVIQNPKAVAYHYTGLYFKYSANSFEIEQFWSLRNFLYFSYAYFGDEGLRKSLIMIKDLETNSDLKDAVIKSFEELKDKTLIEQIKIPRYLSKRLKIFGLNKFSEYPKTNEV